MKLLRHLGLDGSWFSALAFAAAFLWFLPFDASAFPPAPHHVIYGVVRDDYGTPLLTADAQVVLQTPSGVQLKGSVVAGIVPGLNYQIDVPMDAGLTPDAYEPSALLPEAPFKICVVIGQTTNTPIEMIGNFDSLGQPGQRTRIDLTLGVDANGDGLPDAWEQAYLTALGSNLTLANLRPGMILGPDGLTLEQEFLAGNYPFDPQEPFSVRLVNIMGGSPTLEFTAMTGRYYSVLGSADLQQWTPLTFQVPAEGAGAPTRGYFFARSIQTLQVQVNPPTGVPPPKFFRMLLQ